MKVNIFLDIEHNVNNMSEFNEICKKNGPVIIRPMDGNDFKELDSFISGNKKFDNLNDLVKDYILESVNREYREKYVGKILRFKGLDFSSFSEVLYFIIKLVLEF